MAAGEENDHFEKDPIFVEFLNRPSKGLDDLRQTVKTMKMGLEEMKICCLKVTASDADRSKRFTEANIVTTEHVKQNYEPRSPLVFPLASIYQVGLVVLQTYLESGKIPVTIFGHSAQKIRKALAKLTKFLNNFKDWKPVLDVTDYGGGKEADWAVLLVQHLISKLAVYDSLIIDDQYDKKPYRCPCKEKEDLIAISGDTSYGCAKGWHGRADIILIENKKRLAVTHVLDSFSADSEKRNDKSKVVLEPSPPESELRKMKAQSIVFSFLQNKGNELEKSVSLIPLIGIGSETVIIHFYDSVNDVLLQTPVCELFLPQREQFNIQTIVLLWLTLNHHLLCTGTTGRLKQYKANFFSLPEEKLSMYKNNVQTPMCVSTSHNASNCIVNWARGGHTEPLEIRPDILQAITFC